VPEHTEVRVTSTPGQDSLFASPSDRPLAVVDIDGVVADVRHRVRHVEGRPKDWDAFFAAARHDPPLAEGLRRVAELASTHEVVWLTGRPEHLRTVTRDWLAAHGLPEGVLHMRGDRDRRPARSLKLSRVRRLGADRHVGIVLDDDPAVITALREAGWPAELADWVPRAEALDAAQEQQGRS
jgi:hypothetical protein